MPIWANRGSENPYCRSDAAPWEVRAGQRGQPEAHVQKLVVLDGEGALGLAELREFEEVRLAAERGQRHAAIAVERHRLVRDSGDTAQRVHAVEELVEGIIVLRVAHKVARAQGNGVADFRSARLLMSGESRRPASV